MFEDKERWNSRFSTRPNKAPVTPGFIKESIDCLKPGSVLDVASGDGAAALFLASKGFDTSAIDISDVALRRLKQFAQESDLEIETHAVDLDEIAQCLNEEQIFDDIHQTVFDNFHQTVFDKFHQTVFDKFHQTVFDNNFDNIVIAHFKPKADYWPLLVSWLKPGGKLLITTFNAQHHIQNNFSRRFCLEEGELLNISEQLDIEHYQSVERDGDFMDDYLFVKK